MQRLNVLKTRSKFSWGFSFLETLVIIVVIGILAAIAAPSLAGVRDSVRLSQAVTDVRTALMEAQRRAIQESKTCQLILSLKDKHVTATSPCLKTGVRQLPDDVQIFSNILTSGASLSEPNLIASLPPPALQADGLSDSPLGLIADSGGTNAGSNTNGSGNNNSGTSNNGDGSTGSTTKTFNATSQSLPLLKVEFGVLGTANFQLENGGGGPMPQDPSGKIVFFTNRSANSGRRCIAISQTLGLTRIGTYTGSLESRQDITRTGICRASE